MALVNAACEDPGAANGAQVALPLLQVGNLQNICTQYQLCSAKMQVFDALPMSSLRPACLPAQQESISRWPVGAAFLLNLPH